MNEQRRQVLRNQKQNKINYLHSISMNQMYSNILYFTVFLTLLFIFHVAVCPFFFFMMLSYFFCFIFYSKNVYIFQKYQIESFLCAPR